MYFKLAETKEQVERIAKDYVWYDDGYNEFRIAREDIAKAIAATWLEYRATVFEQDEHGGTKFVIATTIGNFLDKVDPKWRTDNIAQLIRYQLGQDEIGDIYVFEGMFDGEDDEE